MTGVNATSAPSKRLHRVSTKPFTISHGVTVQKGPKEDASLMYLLARAQSLSGRPHDALVMLLRLADRGITTDAASNEEFAAVRRLPQWPDVEARLRGAEGRPHPRRKHRPSSRPHQPLPPRGGGGDTGELEGGWSHA